MPFLISSSLSVGTVLGGAYDLLVTVRWLLVASLVLVIAVTLRRRTGPPWMGFLREVAIVVPAYLMYFLVRNLVEGRAPEAIGRATQIIHLEQTLRLFWEPALQEYFLSQRVFLDMMNWVYVWGHWPLIVTVAVWLFFLHRNQYTLYRNAFLISGAIGLVIFAILPVAPPRFMDAWGFVDTVSLHSRAYRVLQPPAFVNQYAAMPSLHFGWNLLIGIAIFRHASSRPLKVIGVLSPVVVLLSIVLTANHYILDALAGGIVALLGLALAIALRRWLLRSPLAPRVTA